VIEGQTQLHREGATGALLSLLPRREAGALRTRSEIELNLGHAP